MVVCVFLELRHRVKRTHGTWHKIAELGCQLFWLNLLVLPQPQAVNGLQAGQMLGDDPLIPIGNEATSLNIIQSLSVLDLR